MHRRAFLTSSGVVAWGLSLPAFLSRTGAAAPPLTRKGAKDTVLVVVELTGGNDGLNTVIPFKDADYRKLRPTLAVAPSAVKKLDDSLGLHPALSGFAELYQAGALSVVQGVGYPNPSQSHFRSMDVWQAGGTAATLAEGWLGKALKVMPNGSQAFHLKHANQSSPLAYEGAPMRVPSIETLADFQLKTASGGADRAAKAVIEGAVGGGKKPGLLDFVSRTAASTYATSKRLAEVGKGYEPKAVYPPTPLAERLKLAAQLIDAGLGARLFYVSIDGFDTHASQAPAHESLLTQLSGAMTAFYNDLKARGHGDRVMMMTFSEFGRRAKENGSKGTDHGSAAPLFLVGGGVKGGVVGAHPSLTKLDDGNLVHHTDFRRVYASVLERWLGVSSKGVLGAGFDALKGV